MRKLEKPVIGAINGVAAGAGISVALACDIRIAADNASFIEVFGRVGLVPDTGSTWFLPRLVGYAKAAEMIFTTDPVDAATAERIGLVNRVVPADQLMAETNALGYEACAGCPLGARACQARAESGAGIRGSKTSSNTRRSSSRSPGRSKDHAEGVAAFVEKRPAKFTGE